MRIEVMLPQDVKILQKELSRLRDKNEHLQARLREAEEVFTRTHRLLDDTTHALDRLKSGVKWSDNSEWFDEVLKGARAALERISLREGEKKD